MRTMNTVKVAVALMGICVLMLCGMKAIAAEAAPPAPAPEANTAAWALEAKTVAQGIGLSPELTTKLADAYKAARESQAAAFLAKVREGGQRDAAANAEVNKAEKAKFETALKGFLNAEQTAKALATLGTFNRRWDRMVTTLEGMGLDAKNKDAAMKLVADFVAESGKMMEAAAVDGDFRAAREKAAPLREKFDADMAKLLTPEQAAKWKEATVRGGGQGRGGKAADKAAPADKAASAPATAPAAK